MNMSNSTFLFSDIYKCSFHNIKWRLSADNSRIVSPVEKNLEGNYDENLKNIDEDVLQDTITFYRQMKKKAKDNCDDEEASLWHYSRPMHGKLL